MKTWTTHHACEHRPVLDPPYEESERLSPHFAHLIQPLDEGRWLCVTCEPEQIADWLDWWTCEADIKVTYDVGTGPEDFYQVEDELVCPRGHKVPQGIRESWVEGDMTDYAAYEQERSTYRVDHL